MREELLKSLRNGVRIRPSLWAVDRDYTWQAVSQ
jgi:hypothetical protein